MRYNKVNSQNPFIPSAEAVRSTDVVSCIRIKVTERVQSKTMDTLVTLNLKPNLLIFRPTYSYKFNKLSWFNRHLHTADGPIEGLCSCQYPIMSVT